MRAWQSVICYGPPSRDGAEAAPPQHSEHLRDNGCVTARGWGYRPRIPHNCQQRLHLQRFVSGHVHAGLRATFQQTHAVEGSLDSLVIIREFSSGGTSTTLGSGKLNALRCPILHADEFVDAVRCGLGCAGLAGPTCAPFSTRAF